MAQDTEYSATGSQGRIREIGVPVKSVNWVKLHPGQDLSGTAWLFATMGQQADNLFVLKINPKTGETQQFLSPVPGSNYPTATWLSRDGKLYIGSSYAGHLLCFDPASAQLVDLGPIHAGQATFPCRIDEDRQGRLWIGSYGTADLTCYDPQQKSFTHYGRMDDVDMYNYPLVNHDGTIACVIRQTKPHVVLFDPSEERKKIIGPVTTKGGDTIDLHRGADGNLYITSSQGNFQIANQGAVPVDHVSPAPSAPVLADGSRFTFVDAADQMYRKLQITSPEGESRVFELDYQASGSDIFYVHRGPDEKIYGSSILPLHLFRYDSTEDQLADLGKCSSATGEAYSMANLGNDLYISSYPGASISVYDPFQPYHFGNQPEYNPRDIGRIDDISYRPRSTLAGPLGRVWLASLPDYGRWGGPLSYYDPATDEKKAYYQICGDASCYTLAHLPQQALIAVGTSISGGSGTQPKVSQATLFLWDYHAERKAWEGTLDRSVSVFNALVTGANGKLYGTVKGRDRLDQLFVFEPESRTFTYLINLLDGERALDLGLQNGPDGKIYGMTSSTIYRLNPTDVSVTVEPVISSANGFDISGPILENEIYYAKGHRLMAARIFE